MNSDNQSDSKSGVAGLRYDFLNMRSPTVNSSQIKCNVLSASQKRFKKTARKEENTLDTSFKSVKPPNGVSRKIIFVFNVVANLLQNIINIKATGTNLNVNV
jgi:hypothetical protein